MWAGSTHVQPSAIAFWRSVKNGPNAHKKPRVGDLVFWNSSSSKYGHVAIYMGKGKILSTDVFVREAMRIGDFDAVERKWGQQYLGAWTPPKLRGPSWKDRH
jgi:cell wall-associated NlpC family hydrolase